MSPTASGAPSEPYVSDVRVLLMGNGADEQLAGYGRHRTRFNRGGWQGLQEELERDTQRLWTRNLGMPHFVIVEFHEFFTRYSLFEFASTK